MNKEQLENMSDFEINKAIACTQGMDYSGVTESMVHDYNMRDYCNNPSDMMPLVFELGIELSPLFCGEWVASLVNTYEYDEEPIYDGDYQSVHNNPLRAAAIVYLLMRD